MSEALQHLILIRHGESEGDARREAWRRGEVVATTKLPEDEELTARGFVQCAAAGLWIQRHIVQAYGLAAFDGCYVSSAVRSEQSAGALDLPIAVWQEDNNLDERNRGLIRGLHPAQHKQRYPDSHEQMKRDILRWTPPKGEALVPDVVVRIGRFLANVEGLQTVIAVTHRDWMWSAQLLIERLTEAELLAIDTDRTLCNAQVVEYSSINPETGEQAPTLMWKRSIDPAVTTGPGEWHILPRVAETYALV